ncbi:MAG TPA: AEC family transporter, partial [Desulfonauticus sp.]|nr:AEC family transporter [Desulfonauticus sp.]
ASFTFEKIKGNLKILVLSTGCKLFFLPLLTYLCLLLFPIDPLEKAVALILAATPTAIATYVMAQELKGDLHLARSLVMLTTLLSIFSFTLYLFLLQKYLF